MFGPERLGPGLAPNDCNFQRHFVDRFHAANPPGRIIRGLGRPPLDPIEMPVYTNNQSDWRDHPREREYQRLQNAAFRWEQTKIDEGIKLITERRPPDFSWQLDAIRTAERTTGVLFESEPSSLDLLHQPKPLDYTSLIPKSEPILPLPTFEPITTSSSYEPLGAPRESFGESVMETMKKMEEERKKTIKLMQKSQREYEIMIAPIVRRPSPMETVFKGAGHSHFSYVKDKGFHVTTNIPGIGSSEGLSRGLSLHSGVSRGSGGGGITSSVLKSIGGCLERCP